MTVVKYYYLIKEIIYFFFSKIIIKYLKLKFRYFSSYKIKKKHKVNLSGFFLTHFSNINDFKIFGYGLDYIKNKKNNKNREIKNENKNYSDFIFKKIACIKPDYKYINWNTDFFSGFTWDNTTYYNDINKVDSSDIKIPLEISRTQFLLYYVIKNDINDLKCSILDFIATQPPYFGTSWKYTMDVAIRAVNFSIIINYLLENENKDIELLDIIYSSLYDHLYFIKNNLERYFGKTNNHYLVDISGLFILATFLNKKKIKQFALKELKKELLHQFHNDGTNFEASTCYHRLAFESIFYPCYFNVIIDKDFDGSNFKIIAEKIFGKDYIEYLYNIFESFLYLLKPNGRMPQIGDNDNGQLIKLYPRDVLDMRYILAIGSVFFQESKWKISEFFQSNDDIKEIEILFGKKGLQIWNSLEFNSIDEIKSKAFKDSGWYIIRNKRNYIIISCGPNGQNNKGGHAHNDKLSFELFFEEDKIVDPGTYNYTSNKTERNKFRSTGFHNTVMIDGKEQNLIDNDRLFYLIDNSKAKCIKWKEGNDEVSFIGEHYGYNNLEEPVIHRRNFNYNKFKEKLIIIDEFFGKGYHTYEWNFNIFNDIKLESEEIKLNLISGEYSKEYGDKKEIKKLYGILKRKLPFKSKIIISIK